MSDGSAVTNGLHVVANLPEEVHWLCEKIEPGPDGKQVDCNEDEISRQESTLHALMLLSYADQETNQSWLKGRVAAQLARCADCMAQFYFLKRRFYHQLLEEHDKENLDLFFGFLEDWDIERILPALKDIARDIKEAPSVDTWYERFQSSRAQRNVVYECFCSPEVLKNEELKAYFTEICNTGKVTVEGPARGLITFLYNQEEPFRSVVEHSWKLIGHNFKPQQFESHMLEALEESVRKAETELFPERLMPFWAGMATVVRNVSKEVITKTICGAKHDPIKLAMNHISLRAPYLHSLLRFYESLMAKLGGEIWDVVSPLTSSTFADILLAEDKYSSLLRNIPQNEDGELQIMNLTRWMSSFIASIRPLQRPTSATPLLRQLFKEHSLPPLSRGICWKEGMKVLSLTLSGVHSQSSTLEGEADRIILRQANELFNEHLNIVIQVATASVEYEDARMGSHMKMARDAAIEALISALKLDIKVVMTDYASLTKKKPELPVTETTIRDQLWSNVCERFPRDNIEFGRQILTVLQELVLFEKVYISNSEQDDLKERKIKFNEVIINLQGRLHEFFHALSRFTPHNINQIVSLDSAQLTFFTGIISSVDKVSIAAEDSLLQAYGVEDKNEALRAMLKADFRVTITALSDLGRQLQKLTTFSLMPKMIDFSSRVLDVLCDRYDGVIVEQNLEGWQKTALRIYWDLQWRWLGNVFKRVRRWAFFVERGIMIEFTRDAMDYADNLFDRYWTFEQALRANMSELDVRPGANRDISWGVKLLQDASRSLHPLAVILTIQDPHLLSTCQALMCKILKLLDQQGVEIGDDYFTTMRKYIYPQIQPEYDPSAIPITNLSEVQKAELSVAVTRIRPDFIPEDAKETAVVEISDDDYDGISDSEMIQVADEASRKKTVHKQTQLQFPTTTVRPADAARSYKPPVKPPVTQSKTGALRVGTTKDATRGAISDDFLAKRKAAKAADAARKAALAAEKAKRNATAVIEDSSEDDSSGDEGGSSLFKLGTALQRSTKLVHDPNLGSSIRPRAQASRASGGPTRRVKDNRARVAPDLSPLYKQILQWEAFHEEPFPPGLSKQDYISVAKSFPSYEAYRKTFEPLLLLEAWVSFQKSKEEIPSNLPSLEVKLVSRMRADNFVELETTVAGMDDRNRWQESDIILLSVDKKPLSSAEKPHCLARVHSINRKFTGAPVSEVQLRCDPPALMMQTYMRNGGTLYAIKIMGLVPLEREYSAMMCLQYYDLEYEIINAKPTEIEEPTEVQIKRTKNLYTVNEPQARAIISAIKNTGFTLIQGPPGTGKTKTVIGIVGALLTPGTAGATAIAVPGVQSKPVNLKTAPKKILVCAPSNAAVDELVIRFKQGVRTTKGEVIIPTIVRIGRSDAINFTVRDVTLEELIERRMAPTTESSKGKNTDMEELRKKHTQLMEERAAKQAQLDDARSKQAEPPVGLQVEIDKLSAAIREQRRALDLKRDQKKESSRNAEVLRRRVQQEIMDEAQIICATLSGSGHDMLRNVNVDFETVIIDEAAQSVELSALIPLKFGCEKCILVGDPKQLPPTVLSREAAKFSYEKSLFVRMQENYPKNVHLLSIQYRMHPMISAFPSKQFYDSELEDGPGMNELRTEMWHDSSLFGPYRFFNVQGRESAGGRTSLVNQMEVDMASALFDRLTTDFPEVDFDGKVGIITPYKQQLVELKRRFQGRYGDRILDTIDFNTTDAFQGRERDIIIFSCVRASHEGGIGFLSDIRRMNVGLTRAKSSLYVLGNANSLIKNRLWGALVQDARSRGVFTEAHKSLFLNTTRGGGKGVARQQAVPGRNGPNQAPWNVAPAAHAHHDPMDIDEPPVQLSRHQPNQRPGPSKYPQGPSGYPPGPNLPRGICTTCGKPGHAQGSCAQGRAHQSGPHSFRGPTQTNNTHDVRIPPIKTSSEPPKPMQPPKPIQPPKRKHSFDSTADGANKRTPNTEPPPAPAVNGPHPLPPKPPPQRPQPSQRPPVRRKDDEGGVFIKPRRRRKGNTSATNSDASSSHPMTEDKK